MYQIKRGDEVLVATTEIPIMCDTVIKHLRDHMNCDLLDESHLYLVKKFHYHIKSDYDESMLVHRHIMGVARNYGLTIEEVKDRE